MVGRTRRGLAFALIALAPVAVAAAVLLLARAAPGAVPRWGLAFYAALAAAPGVLGLWLLPLSARLRMLSTLLYAPFAALLALSAILFAACALWRDCP